MFVYAVSRGDTIWNHNRINAKANENPATFIKPEAKADKSKKQWYVIQFLFFIKFNLFVYLYHAQI